MKHRTKKIKKFIDNPLKALYNILIFNKDCNTGEEMATANTHKNKPKWRFQNIPAILLEKQ